MNPAVIRIEIKSMTVKERHVNGKVFAEQEAGLHNGGDFPVRFRLGVEVGQPYPAGFYTIDPQCFKAGEYGDLTLGRVRLLPLSGNSVAPPAAK